jgi:TonB-dependent SusC/RagA subfamily outer membrane receptor
MIRSHVVLAVALLAGPFLVTGCASSRSAPGAADETGGLDPGDVGEETVIQAEELMIGRFPGVRVYRLPGGGIAVRVWGPGTIYGDAEPLYVVDGMPVRVIPGEGLYWLNPGDIQHIEVLKDVSATSAYGIRGGNGVVLITTRRGDGDER